MSNYIIDNLPNELKKEIFNNSNYISKIIFYNFLKDYDTINLSEWNKELNKYIDNNNLEELILLNDNKLLDKILEQKPKVFYLDTFLKLTDKILILASKFGSDKIINWYCKLVNINDINIEKICCYLALKNGHTGCLKLLKSYNFRWGSNIFLACSKSNNFELFKSMMETYLDIDENLTSDNIKESDKMIKKILTVNGGINIKDKYFANSFHIKKNLDKIYNSVCKNCNIEFIEYLYKLYPQIKPTNIVKCINKKNTFKDTTKVIQWSMNQLLPITTEFCNIAAKIGNFELLIWLRQKGFTWDKYTIIEACRSGNIKMFEYIQSYNDIDNNINLLEYAVESNNLDLVKMLYKQDYKISTTVISFSIISNNYNIFKYFFDNGDYTKFNQMELLDLALQNNNEKFILEFIKRGLFINDGPLIYLKHFQKLNNKLETIKSLDTIFEIGKYLTYTIIDHNYDIFLWYLNKYNNILKEDINKIIKNNNRKLLEWIIENEGDIFVIKELIVTNKKLDYIDYVKGIMTPEDYQLINRQSDLESNIYKQHNDIMFLVNSIDFRRVGNSLGKFLFHK